MVFDKIWFKENQRTLLFLCNNILLKYWFRWILRIHKDVSFKTDIFSIAPNSYTLKIDLNTFKTDFRTHNKFAKRLYYSFKWYWYFRHYLDTFIKSFLPFEIVFAYDTLTAYPDAGTGNTTVDGMVVHASTAAGDTWANVQGGAGTIAYPINSALSIGQLRGGTSTGKWYFLRRGIMTFDTSSIGSGGTITAAEISVYYNAKSDGLSITPTVKLYSASPASNNDLVAGDYDSLGTTSYTDTGWVYADFGSGYETATINAAGISAIDKSGITQYGTRFTFDADNSEPSWISDGNTYMNAYQADETGTTKDPKLVVTYSTAAAAINKIIGII